jgi:hypothetical protein
MNDIEMMLRRMRPPVAEKIRAVFPREERDRLLRSIFAAVPARRVRHGERRATRRRSYLRPVAAGAVVAALAAIAWAASGASSPQAARAVSFRSATRGDVMAIVTNPYAAQSRLNAEFARRGYQITVSLLPVSPSLVGTVLYMSEGSSAMFLEPIEHGPCLSGGGGCRIGIRIRQGFSGSGAIALGRPAQGGESYASEASAFAPGEPLHCSGLLGGTVADAANALAARHLTSEWREDTADGSTGHSRTLGSVPSGNYVWEAVMSAPGKLIVWTQPARWPADPSHGSRFNDGC